MRWRESRRKDGQIPNGDWGNPNPSVIIISGGQLLTWEGMHFAGARMLQALRLDRLLTGHAAAVAQAGPFEWPSASQKTRCFQGNSKGLWLGGRSAIGACILCCRYVINNHINKHIYIYTYYICCSLGEGCLNLCQLRSSFCRMAAFPAGPQPPAPDGSVPRPQLRLAVFPVGPEPRASAGWQCPQPDLKRELRLTVFPAGPQPRVRLAVFPAGPHPRVRRSGANTCLWTGNSTCLCTGHDTRLCTGKGLYYTLHCTGAPLFDYIWCANGAFRVTRFNGVFLTFPAHKCGLFEYTWCSNATFGKHNFMGCSEPF